jgi:UDP-glucuronate 4-epimerase
MNTLVTGGAGFIGSHVVEALLKRGHTVTVVDDFNDFYAPTLKEQNVAGFAGDVALHRMDIRDLTGLERIFARVKFDIIVHLAARAGVRPSLQQPVLYTETNITGTQNLLELARQSGVRRFVFASSSSVYGVNQKIPFNEEDPVFRPISPYAATKLAGEALCHVYHHLYGMSMVCLRFFTVYGPRQRPDLAIRKFTEAISTGQPVELFGDGSTRRDYTYVDDIVAGVMAAVESSLKYEVINLGGSQTVSLIELVRHIEKALGQPAVVRWLPEQPGDVPVTFADVSKAHRLLGYNPRTSIAEGISKFVAWHRQQRR